MPLKYQVETLESVPEALQEHYTESNGVFVLSVDGVKPVAEFQKVFSSLEKERNEHKATLQKLKAFDGKTPDDLVALQTRIMELEASGGGELNDEKVKALVEQRLKPFEAQKAKFEAENAELSQKLQQMQAEAVNAKRKDSVLSEIGSKIKPEFHKDLLYRAERELQFNEDIGGFVDDLGSGLTEWATRQLRETPSWVVPSQGAGGNGGGAVSNSNNPFMRGTSAYNLTEQGRLMRSDPKKAAQLKAQAEAAAR